MKIQDLPQPYRDLAEMRREQQIDSELFIKEKQHFIDNFNKNNELQNAFNWQRSAEKHDFWAVINMGGIPKSLAESLAELKEWQNKTMKLHEGQIIYSKGNFAFDKAIVDLLFEKGYTVVYADDSIFKVQGETGDVMQISLSNFDTYFSLIPPYEPVLIAEQPNALKKAWDEGRLRTIEMLNAGNSTNPLINKDYCMALNPYG